MTAVEYLVVVFLVLLAGYLLLSFWWSRGTSPPAERAVAPPGRPQPAQGRGRIYLAPLGDFPAEGINHLVDYYRQKYGLTIQVVEPIPLDSAVVDSRTEQVVAEELMALMARRQPVLANDPEAIVIGLTSVDMSIRGIPQWRWAFAARRDQSAVVSTARMDPTNYHLPADPGLLNMRMRKMVTKQIGVLYFGLPQNTDWRSVLYSPVLGVDDLDRIGEDF